MTALSLHLVYIETKLIDGDEKEAQNWQNRQWEVSPVGVLDSDQSFAESRMVFFFDVNFAYSILDDVIFSVQDPVQIQVKFLYFFLKFLRLQHLLINALFELILDFALKTEEHLLVLFLNLSNKLVIFFIL